MADDIARVQQYEYRQNSNLVLQVDYNLTDRRGRDDPTSEVLPLTDKEFRRIRIDDKYTREEAPVQTKRKEGEADDLRYGGKSSLLAENTELLGQYKPRTQETRQTYEVLLALIQESIGDQPRDILCDSADKVIIVLKSDEIRETERKKEVEKLLGTLSDQRAHALINLSKKITDFAIDEDAKMVDSEEEREKWRPRMGKRIISEKQARSLANKTVEEESFLNDPSNTEESSCEESMWYEDSFGERRPTMAAIRRQAAKGKAQRAAEFASMGRTGKEGLAGKNLPPIGFKVAPVADESTTSESEPDSDWMESSEEEEKKDQKWTAYEDTEKEEKKSAPICTAPLSRFSSKRSNKLKEASRNVPSTPLCVKSDEGVSTVWDMKTPQGGGESLIASLEDAPLRPHCISRSAVTINGDRVVFSRD